MGAELSMGDARLTEGVLMSFHEWIWLEIKVLSSFLLHAAIFNFKGGGVRKRVVEVSARRVSNFGATLFDE